MTVLIAVVITSRQCGGYTTSSDYFAVKNSKRVTSVILERNNEKLLLKREKTGWKVNDKKEASTATVRFFLETLSRATIKSTVAESLFRNDLASNPVPVVRVTIKKTPGLTKSYLVYQVSSNPYGNYFKKREKGIPYVVNIPGFSGDIGSLYVTNEKFWLPHEVFRYQPSQIRMVSLEYKPGEKSSFMIRQERSGHIELYSLPGELPVQDVNRAKLSRYLTYFNVLRYERPVLETDSVNVKALLSSTPVHHITVEDTTGKEITLRTYPIVNQNVDSGSQVDLNRIYGQINEEKELVIIRYMDIDPILKDLSYFTGDQ